MLNAQSKKLIDRHPHIYSNVKVKDEVEKKDSESKKEESKKDDGSRNSEDCITESEYRQLLDSSKTSSAEEKEDERNE